MRELIDDVKDDEKYYLAAIAVATVNLTSKTTIAIQQSAAAASSSGTYGFSVGLSLDVEGSKSKSNTNVTQSVGSTLTAQNINVTTKTDNNNQTTIQGSAVKAQDNLTINTGELNVIASTDTHTQSQDSENINGSVSMSVYGAASGPQVSMGYGENHSQRDSLTNNNAQLNATNISTATTQDTNIKGGNLEASELLTMVVGGDLNIESQKDSYSSNSNGYNVSAGFGLGNDPDYVGDNKAEQAALNNTVGVRTGNGEIASVNGGYGASTGRTRQKTTVLSSITGKEVNVEVANNTHLKGSLLATGETDANGTFKDNGNLSLTTETLTYTNSSNTNYSSNNSFNVSTSIGDGEEKDDDGNIVETTKIGTSQVDFSMDRTNEKSKTLATLGQGNIKVADTENLDELESLNRDTDKVEKELYAINQSAGAEMTVDTRLFSETGHNEIAEDAERTVLLGEALLDAATKESVALTTDVADGQTGVFSHIEKKQDFYTAAKHYYNDPANEKNREILANPEKHIPQEREAANKAMIFYIAQETGVKPSAVVLMLNDERRGFYSDETGKVYISDNANKNSKETATTVANEASHMIDAQEFGAGDKSQTYKDNREEYSTLIDDAFADKLDKEYASNGYDLSTATHKNSGTLVNSYNKKPQQVGELLETNTSDYDKLDKEKGANSLVPGATLSRWVALKGQYSFSELRLLDDEQNSRIVALTTEKVAHLGKDTIETARKMPEVIEYLIDHPEVLKQLPGYVESAIVQTLEDGFRGMKDIGKGLVTNNLQVLEAQAQAESDLVANLTAIFAGAGVGKVAVIGGKLVVESAGKVAKAVKKVDAPNVSDIPEISFDLSQVDILSIKDARKISGDNKGLIFVQEPQGNFDKKFVQFEAGTQGAFSDILSKRKAVPAIRFDNPNPRGNNFVKFDGIEDNGLTLIDRKTALTTFEKQLQSLQRVSNALKQNPEFKGVFEFPDQKSADKAIDILIEQNITNITVRVAK